ncbi:response regulator transcription factor [Niallia taxi]|uniref:Response regulator transcription factor n=1 Tax=Niallia taxi TaxID=2499688 RepID=A0A437K551_9BACI|nr:response regulator transcription factor [Niallia taxi]MCM3214388.1 response regulator transcription factor [Niallia taxi]MDK8641166.1 response regulator transcription factor [Niallia taxi]MED4039898.1 response regulator transcription factor [Niallia taxi]MED4052574.1 response regulator transcription factor [Niallia taxi]MED4119929.1 response regulator transcription factor [Niallia taxi]
MKRILIIEDEKNLARFIELELNYEGYQTEVCADGRSGLNKAITEQWDVILLDLMLPELNGMEVCRRIRQVKNTPILMITARDNVLDRVSGLDSGADDYLVKPFAIEELLARLRALFRRIENISSEQTEPVQKLTVLTYKDIVLELESHIARKGKEVIALTKREYDLLSMFMSNINIVLTRDVLLNKIWGYESEVETNVIDVYVRYLRNKLDPSGQEQYIETVRGIGYVMR